MWGEAVLSQTLRTGLVFNALLEMEAAWRSGRYAQKETVLIGGYMSLGNGIDILGLWAFPVVAVLVLIYTAFVQFCWNYVAGPVFHAPELSYLQTMAILGCLSAVRAYK